MQSFSNRHGISKPAVPIVVREGAPDPLRKMVWNGALKAGANMLALSQFILDSMFYPHYRPERALAEMAENALMVCPWIEVYEMAELRQQYGRLEKTRRRASYLPARPE